VCVGVRLECDARDCLRSRVRSAGCDFFLWMTGKAFGAKSSNSQHKRQRKPARNPQAQKNFKKSKLPTPRKHLLPRPQVTDPDIPFRRARKFKTFATQTSNLVRSKISHDTLIQLQSRGHFTDRQMELIMRTHRQSSLDNRHMYEPNFIPFSRRLHKIFAKFFSIIDLKYTPKNPTLAKVDQTPKILPAVFCTNLRGLLRALETLHHCKISIVHLSCDMGQNFLKIMVASCFGKFDREEKSSAPPQPTDQDPDRIIVVASIPVQEETHEAKFSIFPETNSIWCLLQISNYTISFLVFPLARVLIRASIVKEVSCKMYHLKNSSPLANPAQSLQSKFIIGVGRNLKIHRNTLLFSAASPNLFHFFPFPSKLMNMSRYLNCTSCLELSIGCLLCFARRCQVLTTGPTHSICHDLIIMAASLKETHVDDFFDRTALKPSKTTLTYSSKAKNPQQEHITSSGSLQPSTPSKMSATLASPKKSAANLTSWRVASITSAWSSSTWKFVAFLQR